jgi:ATP-dependent phosphoenolpyruvate carboxykinase
LASKQKRRTACRQDETTRYTGLVGKHWLEWWGLWHREAYQAGHIRAIIDAIHSGALATAKTQRDPAFSFDVVSECPNVPAEILIPRNVWADKAAFDATAKKPAGLFTKNFAAYEVGVSAEVKAAGPVS